MSLNSVALKNDPQLVGVFPYKPRINLTDFNQLLESIKQKTETIISPQAANEIDVPSDKLAPRSFIELGVISNETPTVSHLLKNHPQFEKKIWNIIFAPENKGKQFTKMRQGTAVALKSGSNELIWGQELVRERAGTQILPLIGGVHRQSPPGPNKPIVIGTISLEKPTVSHLFQGRDDIRKKFLEIINSPININKEYNKLRPGAEVTLDPSTLELFFSQPGGKKAPRSTLSARTAPAIIEKKSGSLVDAVKPFIGTPYEKIDCYGLVVRGLMNQGVQYQGHGGLREQLEGLARSNGLPGNAYLSGEGLVEQAGTKIFSKSLNSISNSREKSEEIFSQLQPHLREGLILSFSTPTRGHTGVVARNGTDWTYINSGLIDNHLSSSKVSKRVDEELLEAEITNWCVLAAGRKESLRVTVGEVNENKIPLMPLTAKEKISLNVF